MTARQLQRVTVYCGSNVGNRPDYAEGAAALGRAIARRGAVLVYGGTHKGLMGILADAALAAGGEAHGVITERLAGKGHLHPRLTRHEVLSGMAARKQQMADLADAVIALPGGIGTLEEFMEVWTLNQLGDLSVPTGLLDTAGYYRPLMRLVDHMIAEGFLPAAHRASLVVTADAEVLLDGLAAWQPITTPKWMDKPA